ncbi:MAG: hypothetical protein D6725_10270 [Planctomycetota bacterium]|nr:MAG: hypothetical protein D6725_10270 [Planctomycetota bacterium]
MSRPRVQSPLSRAARVWRWALSLAVLALALWGLRALVVELCLWRASANVEQRHHTAALRWLAVAGPLDGDNAELHFLLARTYRRLGRFDRVRHHLQRAHELGYPVRELEREQLLALAQTGQLEEVRDHWAELFQNAGSDGPEICEAFVKAAMVRLRIADVLKVLEAWHRDFPDDPKPFFYRGRFEQSLLHWNEAADNYVEVLRRDPDNAAAGFRLAQCLMKLGKFEDALQELQPLVDRDTAQWQADRRFDRITPEEVHVHYATCLYKLGRLDEARTILERELQRSPDSPDVLRELGMLELAAAENDADAKRGSAESVADANDPHLGRAVELLRRAVELQPENFEIRYAYARALQSSGRTKEAAEQFRFVNQATKPVLEVGNLTRRLMREPDNVEIRFRIGEIAYKYQSREAGVRWLKSVLELAPNHAGAHRLLADYFAARGDEQRAAEHRRRAQAAAAPPADGNETTE